MGISNRLVVITVSFAMIGAPLLTYAAEAKPKTHHRPVVAKAHSCPLRRTAEGELVDCQGWRLRSSTIGWDNTCFNLDYLPSQFACSSNGGGW